MRADMCAVRVLVSVYAPGVSAHPCCSSLPGSRVEDVQGPQPAG